MIDLYRLVDLDLDDDARLVFKKLLDKEVFEFLEKNLVLDDDTIVVDSDYADKMKITFGKYTSVLSFQKVNNLNDVNEYIRVISLILKKGGKYFCCFEINGNKMHENTQGVLGNIVRGIKKKNGKYFTEEDIKEFFSLFGLCLIAEKKINNLNYMVFEKK
jgi:hypothetical protein